MNDIKQMFFEYQTIIFTMSKLNLFKKDNDVYIKEALNEENTKNTRKNDNNNNKIQLKRGIINSIIIIV